MTPTQKVLCWLLFGLPTIGLMELWSAVLHGRLWHGRLWGLHKSHHTPDSPGWELNDSLSITHAPIAMAMILYGCIGAEGVLREALFGVGLGMTIFGLAYVVVHDGFIHGRLPVAWLGRFPSLRKIRNAHRVHHRTGAEPYGLFRGPQRLKRLARRR